jgi:hypothetical protein
LGQRVVRGDLLLLQPERPGGLDVRSVEPGRQEHQRRPQLDLAVGRLVPPEQAEGEVQGRHAQFRQRCARVQRHAIQPRVEGLIGHVGQEVALAQSRRLQAAGQVIPAGVPRVFFVEVGCLLLGPFAVLLDRGPVRLVEQLAPPGERHAALLGDERLPDPVGARVGETDPAGAAGVEADEPVALRDVEQLAPPLLDLRGDVERHHGHSLVGWRLRVQARRPPCGDRPSTHGDGHGQRPPRHDARRRPLSSG